MPIRFSGEALLVTVVTGAIVLVPLVIGLVIGIVWCSAEYFWKRRPR